MIIIKESVGVKKENNNNANGTEPKHSKN